MMEIVLLVSFVFGGTIVLDFIWTRCVSAIAHESPIVAANWGAATTVLTAVITISYVNNHWLLVPAAAGAWLGVYFSKRFK
jgi:hypothetical protein